MGLLALLCVSLSGCFGPDEPTPALGGSTTTATTSAVPSTSDDGSTSASEGSGSSSGTGGPTRTTGVDTTAAPSTSTGDCPPGAFGAAQFGTACFS